MKTIIVIMIILSTVLSASVRGQMVNSTEKEVEYLVELENDTSDSNFIKFAHILINLRNRIKDLVRICLTLLPIHQDDGVSLDNF